MTNQKLINQKEFLEKYNLSKEYFDATKLTWDELEKIYVNYLSEMDNMDNAIQPTIKILMSIENIHSVRYRIKKPEHVIRKIIKKKKDNPELVIGVDDYKTILTDLIGLRALHLFKEDAYSICLALKGKFGSPCETPVLHYGAGDSKKYREEFELSGYETKCHNNYYRSIHHIIKTPTPDPEKIYFTEIQIRTIFEEGCSEIDHLYNYPLKADNNLLIDSIHTLNKLAGASDEMGTFIRGLNEELKNKKNREEKINNLSIQLSESNLGREQCEGMVKELESLKETNLGTGFYQSDSTGTSWATPGWLFTNGQGKTYCCNRNCHNYDPCAGGECEDCLNGSCSFQKP